MSVSFNNYCNIINNNNTYCQLNYNGRLGECVGVSYKPLCVKHMKVFGFHELTKHNKTASGKTITITGYTITQAINLLSPRSINGTILTDNISKLVNSLELNIPKQLICEYAQNIRDFEERGVVPQLSAEYLYLEGIHASGSNYKTIKYESLSTLMRALIYSIPLSTTEIGNTTIYKLPFLRFTQTTQDSYELTSINHDHLYINNRTQGSNSDVSLLVIGGRTIVKNEVQLTETRRA